MRFRVVSDVLFEVVEGQGVLIDLKNDQVFSINPTGVLVLSAIIEEDTLSEIPIKVSEMYDISIGRAKQDTERFVANLRDLGYLEEV